MKFIKNSKGISLISALVAAGILGIVMVGLISMFTNLNRAQRAVQAKDQQREATEEIRLLLMEQPACLKTFGGQDVRNPFTVNQIKAADDSIKFQVNGTDRSALLRYQRFQVTDWVADTGLPTAGVASFKIGMDKFGEVTGPRTLYPDVIPLRIKTDPTFKIIECNAIGGSGSELWKQSPANQNNIYYSNGFVGIGTDIPATKFHIVGNGGQLGSLDYVTIEDISAVGSAFINLKGRGPRQNWLLGMYMGSDFHIRNLLSPSNDTGLSVAYDGHVKIGGSVGYKGSTVYGDLVVLGCIKANTGGSSYINLGGLCRSDLRLKSEIQDFSLGLEALLGISPKTYVISNRKELGVIAQDLEKKAPELVIEEKSSKQVNYSALIYVIINSVKELHYRWVQLDQKIADLAEDNKVKSQEIELLKRRLEKLEKN